MTEAGRAALEAARTYETEIVRFLRDMIAIPAESLKEGERCERVRQEYERLGFDEVFFDRLGNVVARVGDDAFAGFQQPKDERGEIEILAARDVAQNLRFVHVDSHADRVDGR